MDGRAFDDLMRAVSAAPTRRGVLGLLGGAALSAGAARLALLEAVDARRKGKGKGKGKGKKKRKCRKLEQSCGGGKKKKCCRGFVCSDGVCSCPEGSLPSGGACVSKEPIPPECENDNDCGGGEICQGGECIPDPEPECVNDNDCDGADICQDGECVPEPPECLGDNDCPGNDICVDGACVACVNGFDGQCVVQCQGSSDCPDGCLCQGLFPGDGGRIACVDVPGDLCDESLACNSQNDCDFGEVCSFTTCGGFEGSGRCFPACVA